MFTDIAGYTAMMSNDEERAFEVLHQNRDLQKPLIEKHDGKWLKEMGDGVLASFPSANQAVRCAISIQQSSPYLLKNKIRIGIHLGDVTVEGNDVFGDGVNIASRLESIADPGGIYISGSVYKAIRSNADLRCKHLGEIQLKNVPEPVNTYAIMGEGLILPSSTKRRKLAGVRPLHQSIPFYLFLAVVVLVGSWVLWKKFLVEQDLFIESIAVLPFDNMTNDPDQEYMVAGMHDYLITALSRISSLRTISKTSTLKYRTQEKTIPEIANELHVDAIVESSVYKVADSIRINVQLIQAFPEEKHLWANTYDKKLENILDLSSAVIKDVLAEIKIQLTPEEESLLSDTKTVNPEAFKAYLNGKYHLEKLSPEGFKKALDFLEQSIALDSSFALAYAEMANYYMYLLQMRLIAVTEAFPKIYRNNRIALDLDPDLPEANYTQTLMSWFEWDWDACELGFKKVLQHSPNHVLANAFFSHFYMLKDQFDKAMPFIEKAIDLDPQNDLVLSLYGVVLNHAGQIDRAIEIAHEALEINPQSVLALRLLEFSSYDNNDLQTSAEMLNIIYSKIFPIEMDILKEYAENGYAGMIEKLAQLLAVQSKGQDLYISAFYNRAGKYEEAIQWAERGYENHDGDMPYFFRAKEIENLKSDPRIRALAEKINLPL